jgi:hypothetical protein
MSKLVYTNHVLVYFPILVAALLSGHTAVHTVDKVNVI